MHRDKPLFDLKKIQSMVDAPTYKRAVQLYESGKIKSFEISFGSCFAIVMGTEPYKVSVDLHRFGTAIVNVTLGSVVLYANILSQYRFMLFWAVRKYIMKTRKYMMFQN